MHNIESAIAEEIRVQREIIERNQIGTPEAEKARAKIAMLQAAWSCLQPSRAERVAKAKREITPGRSDDLLQRVQREIVKAIQFCNAPRNIGDQIESWLLSVLVCEVVVELSRDQTASAFKPIREISDYVAAFCDNLTPEHVDAIAGISAAVKLKEVLEHDKN